MAVVAVAALLLLARLPAVVAGADAGAEAVAAIARAFTAPDAPLPPWTAPRFPPSLPGVSEGCVQGLEAWADDVRGGEAWALAMLDASTKVPEGLLFGHLVHLGNFDECLAQRPPDFLPQHCLVTFSASLRAQEEGGQLLRVEETLLRGGSRAAAAAQSVSVQVAWCLPDSCSPHEIQLLANASAALVDGDFSLEATVLPSQCHVPPSPVQLNAGDVACICVLALVIACAVVSTLYDVITKGKEGRMQLLLAFSVYSNWPTIMAVTQGKDQLSCLHGIRVVSTAWVVLGHVYSRISIVVPSINALDIMPEFGRSFWRLPVTNASVSVDTFFLMSGLLLTFLFLKDVRRTNRFNVALFYVQRYLRLTPALAITIFVASTIFVYAGTGPIWETNVGPVQKDCQDNWWIDLLYVNNYVKDDHPCLAHTWYLSVDTQLYWLSPLVLIPLWKLPRRPALLWVGLLLLVAWAVPFAIVYVDELWPGSYGGPADKVAATFDEYYGATHTRAAPWFIGVLLGHILHESRANKIQLPAWAVVVGWVLSTACMLGSLFGAYPFQQPDYVYNRLEAAFWLSLFRGVWALGVAWVIFACDQGYGGIVNKILSWNFFQPLGRLSYSVYMVHILVVLLFNGVVQTPFYMADVNFIPQFFAVLVMSIVWAIPLALLFEMPVVVIVKATFGHRRHPRALAEDAAPKP